MRASTLQKRLDTTEKDRASTTREAPRPVGLAGLQALAGNRTTTGVLAAATDVQRAGSLPVLLGGGRLTTPPGTEQVSRLVSSSLSKAEFVKQLDDNAEKRTAADWIPSTGLGRFDAEYLPTAGELRIHMRVLFEFGQKLEGMDSGKLTPGGWSEKEEKDFVDAFKTQAETAWSNKFTFQCTKDGWEDLMARVVIDVTRTDKPEEAHFHHKIGKTRVIGTGIGREQNQQTKTDRRINVGNFVQGDADVKPQGASIRSCIAAHDTLRLNNLLESYIGGPIRFEGGSRNKISSASLQKLNAFAKRAKETERPGTVPVPLLVHGKENWRERGKTSTHARDRADAVVNHLNSKNLKSPAQRGKDFTVMIGEQKTLYEGKKNAMVRAEEKTKYEQMAAQQSHREALIAVDPTFAQNFTGDPYSVLAHEFGHMLGNPDEYFDYGSEKVRDAKVKQLIDSGKPEDAMRALQIKKARPSGTASHTEVQEPTNKLVGEMGAEVSEFGPKTASIMSAGADLAPRHAAPMWEVLGHITSEAIPRSSWKLV